MRPLMQTLWGNPLLCTSPMEFYRSEMAEETLVTVCLDAYLLCVTLINVFLLLLLLLDTFWFIFARGVRCMLKIERQSNRQLVQQLTSNIYFAIYTEFCKRKIGSFSPDAHTLLCFLFDGHFNNDLFSGVCPCNCYNHHNLLVVHAKHINEIVIMWRWLCQ